MSWKEFVCLHHAFVGLNCNNMRLRHFFQISIKNFAVAFSSDRWHREWVVAWRDTASGGRRSLVPFPFEVIQKRLFSNYLK